jgi:hypothetical protein
MSAIARQGDERFLALDESVVAVAALGPTTGARGSQPVRVMLTDRGSLVGFKADRGRRLFSLNLDEVGEVTTSLEHPLSFLGVPLLRLQLTLKDGSSISLQTSGVGTTRRARALAAAINEAIAGRGER